MQAEEISRQLVEKGLKVTPQRIAVYEALIQLNNHPTAESIINYIKKTYPNIASATVYKVLDALTEKGLIKRVKTEKDIMRYDAILEKHHHLYCSETDRIEDYKDEDLDNLIDDYFRQKGIPEFEIEDIKLQINGKFLKNNKRISS
jgi:Fur family transcriptional regulator, peroxide stress response regulator